MNKKENEYHDAYIFIGTDVIITNITDHELKRSFKRKKDIKQNYNITLLETKSKKKGFFNMIKKMFGVSIICFALTFILCSCGHNSIVYSDGIGLDTSINPETFTFGLNFRYGKILTACVKEKTEVNLESGFKQESSIGSSENKNGNTTTGLDAKLYIKTGDQITGYTVDLEKAKK